MKIGLVTFHEADNFGAVLQAYALQKTVDSLGASSSFVNLPVIPKQNSYPLTGPAAVFAKKIMAEGEVRSAHFKAFRDEYMTISKPYTKDDYRALDSDFDRFIAGSDQIWNLRIPDVDDRYFLPFADPSKRYSYAASFGGDEFPENVKEWAGKQLSMFSAISVREESGVALAEELSGKSAFVSLDPTLLLSREDWLKVASDASSEDYYLLFLVKYDAGLHNKAKEMAEKDGKTLKVITAAFMPQLGFPAWSGVSVRDWVSLVSHSSGTFTNSFHGCAFSLIFGRPLCVGMLSSELGKRNGRIVDLLTKFGMDKSLEGELKAVDPDEFTRIIEASKAASVDYLKSVVQDG